MPQQTEVRLSYSVGKKVNIDNFENVDIHVSQAVTYDVSDDDQDEIESFTEAAYGDLKADVDARLFASLSEVE